MSGQILELTDFDGDEPSVIGPYEEMHVAGQEQVLCFPRDGSFCDGEHFRNGLMLDRGDIDFFLGDLLKSGTAFIDRDKAEVSEKWIQLIPYCLLRKGDSIFTYRRKGSEGRLTGLLSVGVGGHINPVDSDGGNAYEAGLKRELVEEVGVYVGAIPAVAALVYDPSNAVGKVHMGVCHVVRLPNSFRIHCADPALSEGEFIPLDELKRNLSEDPTQFETWSSLLLANLPL